MSIARCAHPNLSSSLLASEASVAAVEEVLVVVVISTKTCPMYFKKREHRL